MRPPRLALAAALAAAAVLGTLREAPGQKSGGTRYALLVGVNKYDHDDLRPLKYAENDVRELKAELVKTGYQTALLTGKAATKAKVEAALQGLVKTFASGDSLVVGFAGHGLQFERDLDSYFCPVDARPFADRKETLVSVKWVYDRLQKDAAAGPKFLLVDACRNDPKSGRGRGISAESAPSPPRGVGVLLSCSAGETAWEHAAFGTGHGAFFHHVIEGFRGKGKDDEGNVTWDSLRAYVKREVSRDVPRVLKGGARQTPEESGRLAGAPPVLAGSPLAPGEQAELFEYMIEGQKRTGTRRVLKVDLGGGESMEFVRIPRGSFLMGAPAGEKGALDNARPQRQVEVSRDFYLGKFEVTQGQYQAVVGTNPSQSQFKGPRLPVDYVSWDDAAAFCSTLSGRLKRTVDLPTEAQWEYACRAGTTTPFHFGSKLNGDLANCDGSLPYGTEAKGANQKRKAPVGTYPANPWGLHDMHGNVREWTRDFYGPYDRLTGLKNPLQSKAQPNGNSRVLRGGSWNIHAAYCLSSLRDWNEPGARTAFIGFRVCFLPD